MVVKLAGVVVKKGSAGWRRPLLTSVGRTPELMHVAKVTKLDVCDAYFDKLSSGGASYLAYVHCTRISQIKAYLWTTKPHQRRTRPAEHTLL